MVLYQRGSENEELSQADLREALHVAFEKLGVAVRCLQYRPTIQDSIHRPEYSLPWRGSILAIQ